MIVFQRSCGRRGRRPKAVCAAHAYTLASIRFRIRTRPYTATAQVKTPFNAFASALVELAKQANSFALAKEFLHLLPLPLADCVSRMSRSSTVDIEYISSKRSETSFSTGSTGSLSLGETSFSIRS